MPAGPLPCSLIEFYRHINNSQPAERERDREREIIDASVYRWRLLMFHKRVCKGLWGTIAHRWRGRCSRPPPPPTRLPQDTRTSTHITTTLKLSALRDTYLLNTARCYQNRPSRRRRSATTEDTAHFAVCHFFGKEYGLVQILTKGVFY